MKLFHRKPSDRGSLSLGSHLKQTRTEQLRSSALAAFLAVGVASCGGSDDNSNNPSSSATPQPTTPSSIPSYATATVKLGMLSGGNVTFKRVNGQIIGYGGTTDSQGVFSYNPRSLVSQLSSDELVIVEVSGGVDTDHNQDGVADTDGGRVVQGSLRTLVPRSYLESGKEFVMNSSTALTTETVLLTQENVSRALLDSSTVSMEIHDQNSDGRVSYDDTLAPSTTNIEVAPSASGFEESIYTGDNLARREAVEWNLERQNTITTSISIDFRDTQNHKPILSLRTASPNSAIIYTLDGSLPTLESSSTRRVLDQLDIGMQDAQLTYREVYSVDGQQVLGGVESFDLMAGFFMLGQATSRAQSRAVLDQNITETHKGISYFISAKTLFPQDGTGYPAAIDCGSTTYPDYGCDHAPYIAYTQEQKDRFASFIRADIRSDIESGYLQDPSDPVKPVDPEIPPPTHLPSEQVVYRDRTEHLGTWYRLTHTYNLDGKSDFPVKITGSYALPNAGRQDNIETLVYAASDLSSQSEAIIEEIKSLIKKAYDVIPKPTYPQNTESREPGTHRGSPYTLITVMNINGDMDYPARVYVEYSLPDGTKKTTARSIVNDESEKSQVQADAIASAKSRIDVALDDRRTMGEVELTQGITYDRGGSYKVETHYSFTPGKDYPGHVVIDFTLPNGISDRWTREVETEYERDDAVLQGVEWVQDQITLAIPTEPIKPLPIYPQNHQVDHTPRTEYLGAWYSLTQYYNLNGDADYPVKIIGSYSLPNGGRQENKEGFAHTLEEITTKTKQILDDIIRAIKEVFDALPKPTYPQNTELTDRGSYRGYDYTLVTVMNLTGDSDYPAKVYVDYTLPSGQIDRTIAAHANDAQELQNMMAERLENVRAKLDQLLDDTYSPGYVEIVQDLTNENGGEYRITFEYAYDQGKDYPGYVLIDYTLPDGTGDRWTHQVENSQQKNNMIEQGRSWVRDQIARSYPPAPNHAPNQIVRQFTRVYGSGEYSLYTKYNRVGNGQDYPAFVFGEYIKYHLPDQIFNPPATQKEVYSTWEEEQAIRDIESYIQGRLSIGQRTSASQVQTSSRLSIADVLRGLSPISTAYAANSDPQWCAPEAKKAPFKYSLFPSPILQSKLPIIPACAPGHAYRELFVYEPVLTFSPVTHKTEPLRHATRDQNPAQVQQLDNDIQSLINLQQTNGSAQSISEYRQKILQRLKKDLPNAAAFADGAGDAIYDQIADAIQLAKNLADARAIYDEAVRRFETIRNTYYVNGAIQWDRMKNDLTGKAGAEYQKYEYILTNLPRIIGYLDERERYYISGFLLADIGLGMINPLKKVNLVTGKKSRGIEMAEDAISRGYKKKDDILIEALLRQPEKRTISSINDFYDKLGEDEANQAIDLLKKGRLKVLNRYGVEYGFREGKLLSHMRVNEKLYNEGLKSKGHQSYFSDNLSETDLYNLHIRMMNLLTQEDFNYLKGLNGRTGDPIELGMGEIGWDDKNKVSTSKVCVSIDSDNLVHAYPCVK